jgi:hypothetical protein
MPSTQTVPQPASIDNVFATGENDIYADRPFYGALFRVSAGSRLYMQYVNKDERLTLSKFLEQKNIDNGSFLLKTTDGNDNEKEISFQVDKNGDMETLNPFAGILSSTEAQPRENGMNSKLKQEYEAQIVKLRGKVSELTDELVKVKRELGDDNTELMLSHEKEKRDLEKRKDQKISELKEQLSELKTEIRFKELENKQENGERSIGNRLMDILEHNLGDDFLSNMAENIGNLMEAQQNPGQPTPRQLQQAMQQAAGRQQGVQNAPQPENNPSQPVSNPQPQTASPSSDDLPPNVPTPDQMKQQFIQGVKSAALEALTANNEQLKKYSTALQQQLALNEQQGVTLNAGEWVNLAKMLAEKAVKEEINPGRVAKVIEPVLAGIPKKYKFMLKTIDPGQAAKMLFQAFSIDASPAVEKVVSEVLEILKK